MYNNVIKLVKVSKTRDSYGDIVESKTERTAFADVRSIGMSEFYQANANGFKPTIKFVIADYLDYQNEERVIFKDFNESEEHTYSVVRTFRNGNSLEITCERLVNERT